jgi:hypothetical protein
MTIIKRRDLKKDEIYYSEPFVHSYDSSLMKEQGPFLVIQELNEGLVIFLTKNGIESRNFDNERTFIKLS